LRNLESTDSIRKSYLRGRGRKVSCHHIDQNIAPCLFDTPGLLAVARRAAVVVFWTLPIILAAGARFCSALKAFRNPILPQNVFWSPVPDELQLVGLLAQILPT
jgi:hypothetical protein